MTDLQLGLLVIGAAAVAGVLIYNRVQERAGRRDARRDFASAHPDVLAEEPALRREPVMDPPPRRSAGPPSDAPDPRFDYVMRVEGAALPGLRAGWSQLEHRFAGRAMLCESDGALQAALQLVNRSGVVGEAELLEFRSQVETLAAAQGAQVAAPEMRAALDAAGELDRACADVDIQIALHVLGGAPGEFVEGAPFKVAARADGVTLLLDVPRTPDLARSYAAMVRSARELGGRMVDDNGNELGERALAAIGVEVEAARARLAALGVEPGSPLALRLFS